MCGGNVRGGGGVNFSAYWEPRIVGLIGQQRTQEVGQAIVFCRLSFQANRLASKQFLEQAVLRIWVTSIRPKSLAIRQTSELPSLPCPAFHLVQVVVGSVMFPQPASLARVPGRHLALARESPGHIYNEIRRDQPVLTIAPCQRIHQVERRNSVEGPR